MKDETEKHNIRTHCVTCHGWNTHTHIWVTPCNLWFHTTSSQTLTLPQTKLSSCYFMVISGLCGRWAKGQTVGDSNTVSSSVGGRRGSFRKYYHVTYHNCCLIINSYACTGICHLGRDAVIVPVVPSVSKEHSAFSSKGQAAHHNLADMNSQQHHCQNLNSPICLQFM